MVGLKIVKPAGDTVEISSNNESLRSVALEVTLEADREGVEYFVLQFKSPDGRIATYEGYGDSPAIRDPLAPQDKTRQTYVLGSDRLSQWSSNPYESAELARTLDTPGQWTLSSAFLYARNGKSTDYRQDELPAALPSGFQVTRWFTAQPASKSVLAGGLLSLAPVVDPSVVTSPNYQWYRNGEAVAGANGRVFSRSAASPSDAGLYYLEVRSGATKVRSDAVAVSVRSSDVVAARAAINGQNAVEAKKRAAAALKTNPNGGEELFVSALSELLGVLSDPKTGAALTSFGASAKLKFPFPDFNWSGNFPAAASSATFNSWLLSVFLPAVEKADAALEKITDPRFVTTVGASDFGAWGTSGSTFDTLLVDYGDIQALRLGCNLISTIFRMWTSMDTAVRLDSLQTLLPQGKVSIEALLRDYPKLLAAASGGGANQSQALDALGRMAAAYLKFSNFIYNPLGTPGAVTRYIDGDLNLINAQRQFAEDGAVSLLEDPILRDYALNITESLSKGERNFIANVTDEFGVSERYPVNLNALKARPAGLRSSVAAQNLLPQFTKNTAFGAISNTSLARFLPAVDTGGLVDRIRLAEPQITKTLGTREDQPDADQTEPVLILTGVPANGSKVLLSPDASSVLVSGKVQDESDLGVVVLERTIAGSRESFEATTLELPPEVVAGKRRRTWEWSVELPFDAVGVCQYSIYATDQFDQKSVPKTGSFTVVRAVRVEVLAPDPQEGTLTVTPPIPKSGLVETGTNLRVSAVPKAGYLFDALEVLVDGVSLDGTSRPTASLVVAGETTITPRFVVNPFPVLAGQWTGASSSLGMAGGFVTLTVTKTGAFTLKLVQGRKAFSHSGTMGASGSAPIKVSSTLYPFVRGENSNGSDSCSLRIVDNGIQFFFGEDSASDTDQRSSALAKAASPKVVRSLPSRRFNAALGEGTPVGYAGFDVTAAGLVLSTGMVSLEGGDINGDGVDAPQRMLKYTFSSPLVLRGGSESTDGELPGVSFYALDLANPLCVNGFAVMDGSTLSGSLGTATVRTEALDPAQPVDAPENYGSDEYYRSFLLSGIAYTAPKSGQLAPPFSASEDVFAVTVSAFPGESSFEVPQLMGDLKLVRAKPVFVYRAEAGPAGEAPLVKTAKMSFVPATGAFSGSLTTQVNGVPKARNYNGVVLRAEGDEGEGPVAVGISADGLLISFEKN